MLAEGSDQAKVIRLTGHGSEGDDDLASMPGVFACLWKPAESPHGCIVNRNERRVVLWPVSQRPQGTL
jgi:hypothetical protein